MTKGSCHTSNVLCITTNSCTRNWRFDTGATRYENSKWLFKYLTKFYFLKANFLCTCIFVAEFCGWKYVLKQRETCTSKRNSSFLFWTFFLSTLQLEFKVIFFICGENILREHPRIRHTSIVLIYTLMNYWHFPALSNVWLKKYKREYVNQNQECIFSV